MLKISGYRNLFRFFSCAAIPLILILGLAACGGGGGGGGSSDVVATETWSFVKSGTNINIATLTLKKYSSGSVSSSINYSYYDTTNSLQVAGAGSGSASISSYSISVSATGSATGGTYSDTCTVSASGTAQDGNASVSATNKCPNLNYTSSGQWTGTLTSGSGITYVSSPGGGASGGTTYTVTYNGNGNTGGSAPTDVTAYSQSQNVTVLGNTGNLAKTGYTFVGWNTQANGSGTTYTQGQTFAMGIANVTLYALWSSNQTYTLTYSGNGSTSGVVPVDSNHYLQGQSVAVLGNTGSLAKSGYSFLGWNTQANGSGTTYTQGQVFTMGGSNVILYAQWTANPTYIVTYNGNGNTGGSVPVDTNYYLQGQSVTVLGNTGNLAKSGYSFIGWNTQANGGGTTFTQWQTFSIGAANVTLYAQWAVSQICTPNQTRCISGNIAAVQTCNASGTAWTQSACPNWKLCSNSACRTICDITTNPGSPTICMVPNHDGVNNGEWLTWYDSSLTVPTYVAGQSLTSTGGTAPIYSSGQTWPYSWSISTADAVGMWFRLDQYGSYKHPRLGFKARRSNIVNDGSTNRYSVGIFNSVPNLFASCVWGPVSFSWSADYCDVGTYYTGFNYSGGTNSMLFSITGDGFGHAVDLLDVNYLYLSILP